MPGGMCAAVPMARRLRCRSFHAQDQSAGLARVPRPACGSTMRIADNREVAHSAPFKSLNSRGPVPKIGAGPFCFPRGAGRNIEGQKSGVGKGGGLVEMKFCTRKFGTEVLE